ncbi:cell wall-binding repeat-containing protein [Palaeococcus ferrophilus]|uniref:cell wall-binding repeat-containing protein n=1 Tax=Palaeococcus ferrophilus TaxID=83868 RepID=UPI00064F0B32|nr:hypothetical protein [Palaeococcus ferrophilus]
MRWWGGLLGANVITTEWGTYSPEVTMEVLKEEPDLVIVIGGTVAVPPEYEEDFSTAGVEVMRWGGSNREETSYAVFTGLKNSFPSALEGVKSVVFIEGRNPAAYGLMKSQLPGRSIVLFVDMGAESFREVALSVVEAIGAGEVEILLLAGKKGEPLFGRISTVSNVSKALEERGVDVALVNVPPSRNLAARAITKAEEALIKLSAYDDRSEERLEKAKELLERARSAYERGDYQEAYILALTAEGYADVVRKRNLDIMRSTFQGSGKHGLEFKLMRLKWIVKALEANGRDISDLESLIAEIESLINSGRYGEAAQKLESLKKDIRGRYARGRESHGPPQNPGGNHRP